MGLVAVECAACGGIAAWGLPILAVHRYFITHFPEVYFENKSFFLNIESCRMIVVFKIIKQMIRKVSYRNHLKQIKNIKSI